MGAGPAQPTPLPEGLIDRLSRVSSGSLTTELFRRGLRQCVLVGVKPLNPAAGPFAGEAFTLRFIPAREDVDTYRTLTPYPNPDNLQWEAVERIERGQVLVVDSRGDASAASAGDILIKRLKAKGAAAIVTDGSLRDGQEIAAMAFPACARAVVATSRLSAHHAADIQTPIACAGVAVYPGDLIVGDADGVTVVPRAIAQEVCAAAEERDALEAYLALRVVAGEPLYGVYPPTDQTRADYLAWKTAGGRDEDAPHIRAPQA